MRAFILKVMGLVLLVPALASSQTYLGGVRGAVRDADGGVLPGTTVTLTNAQTGITRTSVTNERGEYVFASVAPGTYNLGVELTGFAPFLREALEVGVQTFFVQDVTMQVGSIAESVTVTGESPIIETANASIASAIDKAQLDVLPSPGRNVFIYSVTTPNVIHTGDPIFVRKQDQTNSSLLSLAGGPLRGNNYTLDGVSIVDMRNRAVIIPNNDAVEEMKVQVNTYDAEMGRTGGGVFNVLHKSGTNNWGGSALWQNRPIFGRGLLFFEKTENGGPGETPDQPYNLWSFAGGGPIIKDKTFFWASYEGYKNTESRNTVIALPTRAQANGNFAGGPTIYDPLTYNPATGTRSPFPGNVIPANRIDPVGRELANLLLTVGEGPIPMTALLRNKAVEPTFKIDHQFNQNWQVSGAYLYYDSEEPANPYYSDFLGQDTPIAFDTGASILFRTVHTVAVNVTNIPSDDSVVTFRYGYNRFYDSVDNPAFDIGSLPFDSSFQSAFRDAGLTSFPLIDVENYGTNENATANNTHGSWADDNVVWKSQELSGVYSKFVGSHTFKGGLQFRKIGVDTFLPGYGASFYFTPGFTRGPTPFAGGSGDAFASLLLGLPTDDSSFTNAGPTDVFIKYWGGFVQDDWRVNENLVLNLGLRIEHEDGLAEQENRFAVGWAYDDPFPVQVPGLNLRGGLQYAGTGGRDTQSDPASIKVGPRAGFVYSLNDKTVLRGGYGVFWAPHQYPGPSENTFATRGFTAITAVVNSNDGGLTPSSARLQNPYPNGVAQPTGNSLGALTGAGSTVRFNDQFAKSPYMQQWSIDIQRELSAGMAVKIGYLGSKGTDFWIGGTGDSEVNINQLDPSFLSLGSALNDAVANPFFGNEAFGSLADNATLPRGQLLRPYPQFRDVWARHISEGKSIYNALRLEFEKKFRTWGARVNYVYSQTKTNILETGNTRIADEKNTAFNSRNLDTESLPYARIDSPHWVNLNGLYRFPSPDGGAAEAILGGWSASVTTILRSGFPLTIRQSSNNLGSSFGFEHQRPNLVGDPSVSDPRSNYEQFINPAAFANAPAFTFGNTPQTITDQRSAPLLNWDVSFDKTTNIGAGQQILLRFEFVNIFSQPNFNGPRSVFGQSNFGAITGVGGYPTVFQFMLKYIF